MGDTGVKHITRPMRLLLVLSGVLVVLAGLELTLHPGDTDERFAWTIRPSITSAALGGFYLAAIFLTFLSARQRLWASVRIFAPGTLAFSSLILVATLIHLDKFHTDGPTTFAQVQAGLWIGVYVCYPPLLVAAWLHQHRAPGGDPPRIAPLAPRFRLATGAQAAVLVGVGAALLIAPAHTADALWPWTLTPLTGRALGAWMFALGLVLVSALRENDWTRIPVAPATHTAVGVFQLAVVARYADDLDWGAWTTWAYAGFFASVVALGVIAWMLAARERAAQPEIATAAGP
jgi:hypothetical protein